MDGKNGRDMEEVRLTLDQTFMDIAYLWAHRGTCSHLKVGAVLARDGRTIASGYNGAPPGMDHCRHDLEEGHVRCTNTNHAEGNALAFAARYGVSTVGTTLYTTHSPCKMCAGLLISAGVVRVVYDLMYMTENLGASGLRWLEAGGVVVEELE